MEVDSSSLNPILETISTTVAVSSVGWPWSVSHERTASAPAFASPLYFQSRTSWSSAASSTVRMEDVGRFSSWASERAVVRTREMCHQSCEPSWPASSDFTQSSASETMDAVMTTRECGRARRSRSIRGEGRGSGSCAASSVGFRELGTLFFDINLTQSGFGTLTAGGAGKEAGRRTGFPRHDVDGDGDTRVGRDDPPREDHRTYTRPSPRE